MVLKQYLFFNKMRVLPFFARWQTEAEKKRMERGHLHIVSFKYEQLWQKSVSDYQERKS